MEVIEYSNASHQYIQNRYTRCKYLQEKVEEILASRRSDKDEPLVINVAVKVPSLHDSYNFVKRKETEPKTTTTEKNSDAAMKAARAKIKRRLKQAALHCTHQTRKRLYRTFQEVQQLKLHMDDHAATCRVIISAVLTPRSFEELNLWESWHHDPLHHRNSPLKYANCIVFQFFPLHQYFRKDYFLFKHYEKHFVNKTKSDVRMGKGKKSTKKKYIVKNYFYKLENFLLPHQSLFLEVSFLLDINTTTNPDVDFHKKLFIRDIFRTYFHLPLDRSAFLTFYNATLRDIHPHNTGENKNSMFAYILNIKETLQTDFLGLLEGLVSANKGETRYKKGSASQRKSTMPLVLSYHSCLSADPAQEATSSFCLRKSAKDVYSFFEFFLFPHKVNENFSLLKRANAFLQNNIFKRLEKLSYLGVLDPLFDSNHKTVVVRSTPIEKTTKRTQMHLGDGVEETKQKQKAKPRQKRERFADKREKDATIQKKGESGD
ncbi:hypothetical protein AGDE_17151 [Angomonas deanei]|uniref:Uncharacterized protein n=1 Tax=Angomonas deanei TaxID=59799 RepID=A0A7G2C6D1_9TRYP|nr:hypothetical protein AGDE_17151 [Angomonas deanei]CAD2214357.1 hypothetical protein, conserved [Angomonas deanei]|eukprot:EPY15350.1 hypothetical protein AGDE_17151 [Angomonas deanei]